MNEAKYRANKKYDKQAYDQQAFVVRRDVEISGDVIRRYAESKGISVNALIRGLLEERIRNDADFVI